MIADDCRLKMRAMLDEHGLTARGWTFVFDKAQARLGQCRYTKKQIGLSRYYVDGNDWAQVEQTALHEVAHALVGPGHHHDATWKAQARAIGVRAPKSTGTTAVSAPPKWVGVCPACQTEYPRLRRPRGGDASCGKHGGGYKEEYRLNWRQMR